MSNTTSYPVLLLNIEKINSLLHPILCNQQDMMCYVEQLIVDSVQEIMSNILDTILKDTENMDINQYIHQTLTNSISGTIYTVNDITWHWIADTTEEESILELYESTMSSTPTLDILITSLIEIFTNEGIDYSKFKQSILDIVRMNDVLGVTSTYMPDNNIIRVDVDVCIK